ncbi:MAG: hypothetical protein P1U41_03385 [Vicingaceae bacterium]|nr:hypothetical protein [Vicingaceae bacterium]
MMKQITIITLALLVWSGALAQSPDLINYQAVARDLSGNPLVSTAVNITYDIRQNSSIGTIVYSETHNLTTNQFGLFTAEIGGGTPVTGTFAGINWSTGLYYLQVTVNGDVMAATQLLSVPYALHANTATSGSPGANGHANLADSVAEPAGVNCANGGYLIHMGADDNDNNTLEPLERDISYYICNGLDGSANNNDTSATNEIQTLSISNDTIFLSNGGFVKLPPALGDDWGSQVVVSSGSNISGDGTAGNPLMVTDSVDDADNDPNNERITTFALNSTNDSLIIVEAGVGHAFPLSNLNDGDWTKGTGNDIFNNSDSIGIGTNNPKSLFQIGSNMHLFPFSLPGPEEYAVNSYNSHDDGTTIRNTTGGVSGFSFLGHKNGQPNYGVHLFSPQPAGTDMTLLNPELKINLSNKGFGVYVDNPDAGIDVEPLDSAGIIIRMADNGSTANLFFEDTQNMTVGFKAPTVLSNNYGLTLPVNLPTTSGSSLVSDLAGNLSWEAPKQSLWSTTNAGAIHPSNIIDSVGIGTVSPASLFHVYRGTGLGGGAYSQLIDAVIEDNNFAYLEFNGGSYAGITFNDDANSIRAGYFFDYTRDALMFRTGGFDNRMVISEIGNVGIGTAAPLSLLHLYGGTGLGGGPYNPIIDAVIEDNDYAYLEFNGGNYAGITFNDDSSSIRAGVMYNYAIDALMFRTGGFDNRMLISESGDVGIGTATPGYKLDIVGGDVQVDLGAKIGSRLGTTGSNGYFVPYDANGRTLIWNTFNSSQGILFGTSNTERMRINSIGNVGIGTTTPSEKLGVAGDVIANNYKYATPKARFLTIGESDFRMARSSAGDIESSFGTGGVGIVNATGTNTLVAPVYLPQGAVVSNVEVYYVDNSTSNMTVLFERRGLTGTMSGISSASTTNNSATVQNLNLVGTTTIDNENNSYGIRVYSTGWPSTNALTMKIYTVKIHYSIIETD